MPASIQEAKYRRPGDPSAARGRGGGGSADTGPEAAAGSRPPAAAGACRPWIVSDCSTFVPPFTAGGTERQLSELARQLELCGAEVTLLVRHSPTWPAGAPPMAEDLRTQYVPPAPVPKGTGWAALGPNLRYIVGTLRQLLRARREYDVLIVSGFKQLALPISLLARLLRKPCLLRIDTAWDLDDELTPE